MKSRMLTMLDRKDFCCDEIYNLLKGDEHGCEIYFTYLPVTREYCVPYKKEFGSGLQVINYCPWCGRCLPNRLREELFNIIELNYGKEVSFFNFKKNKKVSNEFKTDEWWKKRGL